MATQFEVLRSSTSNILKLVSAMAPARDAISRGLFAEGENLAKVEWEGREMEIEDATVVEAVQWGAGVFRYMGMYS